MSEEITLHALLDGALENTYVWTVYETVHNAALATDSGTGWASFPVGQWIPSTKYNIYRGYVFFDTSSIPEGAIILNAKLYIKLYERPLPAYRQNFNIVIRGSEDAIYPHNPVVLGDYLYTHYEGNYGSINTSEMTEDVYVCITLTAYEVIKCGGITKIMLISENDINSQAPIYEKDEFVDIYSIIHGESYGPYIEIEYEITKIINIKAEPDSTQTAIKLYGEILTEEGIEGGGIAEKGFEYIIQDEEPTEEATGIEVIKEKPEWMEFWEIGEYWAYEYEGNDVDFWDRLYHLLKDEEYEHDIIWWFRAYFKDGEDNKYVAETWMKNVPSLITSECTEVLAQQVTGNGELTDKGANIVTRLGFRIIKEYSGDLSGANTYIGVGGDFRGELEIRNDYSESGILIGFVWAGTLYRDSLDTGDFELGIYDKILGGGFLGEGLGIYLKPNDTYKIQAVAENELGKGFGEEVEITTGQNFIYEEDEPIISPTSVEKTVTLRNIPEGAIATRVGIRLGRTRSCNEIDVYIDGEWGNDDKITFFIPDLEPGEKYYEEPYMVLYYEEEWEEEIIDEEEEPFEMPEEIEDWDYDTIIPTYEEYNYKTIIREIRCEKMSDQSFIDKAGRRRSITLINHLIQTEEVNREVINDYLNKFQIIKLKVSIDYDIPIPFERGDVILIGEGNYKFKADGEGEILFKAGGEGEIPFANSILAKIRKIDSYFTSGIETILGLELEV